MLAINNRDVWSPAQISGSRHGITMITYELALRSPPKKKSPHRLHVWGVALSSCVQRLLVRQKAGRKTGLLDCSMLAFVTHRSAGDRREEQVPVSPYGTWRHGVLDTSYMSVYRTEAHNCVADVISLSLLPEISTE